MRCTPSGDWCADLKWCGHPSPPGDRGRSSARGSYLLQNDFVRNTADSLRSNAADLLDLNATVLRRRIHWLVLFVLTCIVGYIVLMIAVQAVEIELERELNRHDLDGDGSFSENEMTAEAERAMDAWASDTGRTFAPIFGIPITIIWTTINFLAISIIDWFARFVWRSIRGKNAPTVSDGDDAANLQNVVAADTGNPYQPPTQPQGRRTNR